MENDNIDILIEEIRGSAYGLSNKILELIEDYDVDMWEEILEYLNEKKELESNG